MRILWKIWQNFLYAYFKYTPPFLKYIKIGLYTLLTKQSTYNTFYFLLKMRQKVKNIHPVRETSGFLNYCILNKHKHHLMILPWRDGSWLRCYHNLILYCLFSPQQLLSSSSSQERGKEVEEEACLYFFLAKKYKVFPATNITNL